MQASLCCSSHHMFALISFNDEFLVLEFPFQRFRYQEHKSITHKEPSYPDSGVYIGTRFRVHLRQVRSAYNLIKSIHRNFSLAILSYVFEQKGFECSLGHVVIICVSVIINWCMAVGVRWQNG